MVLSTYTTRMRRGGWPARAPAASVALALVFALAPLGCRFHERRPAESEVLTDALESEPWGRPNDVIVMVNERPITRGEFYLRVLRRFGTMKLLSGVIKEELFLQEAQRLELSVSSQELSARIEQILTEMAREVGGREALEARYLREGLSLAMVRRDLEREVATQLLIGKVTRAHRTIDDETLQKYYRQTYGQRRWMVRQIAYAFRTAPGVSEADETRERLEARNKALRAADRVRSGGDFQVIARAESEDPMTSPSGGWLGPIHRDTQMRLPQFKEAIFRLEQGEVSEPVENPQGGYHVFLAEAVIESESFVDCEDKMRRELEEMEPELEEIEAVLRELQARGSVEVETMPFAGPVDSEAGARAPGDGSSADAPAPPADGGD